MHLTVHDAARILRVPEKQVYRWIDDGQLPCYWVNEQARLNGAELLEWATARRINVDSDLLPDAADAFSSHPNLSDALLAGGIHHEVGGSNRESVLRAVAELIPLPDDFDRELLVQVLLAREAAGTTAVGDGIAIPHVRQPIAVGGGTARSSITLCFLKSPVPFGSGPGSLIHVLFTMVTPTVRNHLQLLAKLASALHNRDFKEAVLRRAPKEEILERARHTETRPPHSHGSA